MMYGNLTIHTDKYQINMMFAHWVHGTLNDRAVFDVYFLKLPFGNGFAVCAGLERIVNYISTSVLKRLRSRIWLSRKNSTGRDFWRS